jgi:acetyl-CoA acetyltransferase family protein
MSTQSKGRFQNTDPVIVDGVRTPFMRSNNSFIDMSSCDLGKEALAGLIAKTGIDKEQIEHVIMGTVIHDPRTPNVARESVLSAGFPVTVPAHTVSLACISSNVAATQIADMIKLQKVEIAVASGTDTCSDPPIRLSRNLRKTLVKLQKVKKPLDLMKEWKTIAALRPKDMVPDVPSVSEYSNGKSMGQGAEILSQRAGISRAEADQFAAMSHANAVKAQKENIFADYILNISTPPKFKMFGKDDGPREDSTVEKISRLSPAFDKVFGVCTAANSSFLTDGASAMLMMSMQKSKELKMPAKAVIKDYIYAAGEALTEMLMGPALTIPLLLKKNNLTVSDVDVWEIHEAFAAQVLANLKLMTDKKFAKDRLKMDEAIGEIPIEKINVWGGSLSLGHPFGATGTRLLWTAAHRLQQTNTRYAIVSGCAAGGHGSAILLENPNY